MCLTGLAYYYWRCRQKKTDAGVTPLYIACQEGHAAVVSLLINTRFAFHSQEAHTFNLVLLHLQLSL